MDALAAPAWVVALGSAAFFGAKVVLAVRYNGNGKNGSEFAGRVLALLETQGTTLAELRNIAADTREILRTQGAMLAAHDQRSADAIRRMDARHE